MNFLWPFRGKRSSVIPYLLLLLYWDKISPWAFIIAFYLSVGKADDSSSLQSGLTTVLNKEMRSFILIRDGRLAIDYSSYGNLSDQLNLRLRSLSHLSLNLIILNALNYNSLGRGEEQTVEEVGGECGGCVGFRVECVAEVYNMWPSDCSW